MHGHFGRHWAHDHDHDHERGDDHERGHYHFGGRHRRHGFGHFFAHWSGEGMGARGFRMGRKIAGGDLQLLILALLAEDPRHGYELIKAFEERSNGFYSPSPGMIYPALTYLEELGYAVVEHEGAKKLYRITDTGRAHLEENRELVDSIFSQLDWIGKKMDGVRRAFAGDEAEEGGRDPAGKELHRRRNDLRAALHEKRDASTEERQRVAEILKRAAEEIRGK